MRLVGVVALVFGFGLVSGVGHASESPVGTWRMTNGKVTVRVSQCGAGMCARVVALKKPRDDEGRPRVDKENPNPALRQRPVIGLTVLSNMKARGKGRWSGTIYNPDDGNTYSSAIQITGPSTMKVNGCVAGVLCKSTKFIRVD